MHNQEDESISCKTDLRSKIIEMLRDFSSYFLTGTHCTASGLMIIQVGGYNSNGQLGYGDTNNRGAINNLCRICPLRAI